MRAVVAELRARGLTVHVDDRRARSAPAVPARVATAISNATREALSNVAAHAGTGEAWVEVRLTASRAMPAIPGRLQVTVRDQGAGFDPARVDRARLGLRRSIAERVADCGGQASIWSAPGQGTVVSLSWPASPAASRRPARPAWRTACRGAHPGEPVVVSHARGGAAIPPRPGCCAWSARSR